MRKLDILGIEFIIVSIVLGVILYKLEISKHIIDEDYEYIKKHRIFGNLTKYLTIISIISIVLIDLRFIIYKDYEFKASIEMDWLCCCCHIINLYYFNGNSNFIVSW